MSVSQDVSTHKVAAARADIRSLMVHVEGSPETSARLHSAVDLARQFDATLIGVGVETFRPYTDPTGMLGDWVVELEKMVQEDLKRAEATFKAKSAGLKTEWLTIETMPDLGMAQLARSADLIIAGGRLPGGKDAYRSSDTADVVMLSGRPVLVVPPAGAKFRGEAVVVAWKDTRESRRAVADSLPFLKAANDVVVFEVCDKASIDIAQSSTLDVVKYLRRHGVAARAKVSAAQPSAVATELQDEAMAIGADLIVAGAYGHSRLGEWMFGGVTADLLAAPERFILMSH